MISKIFLTGKSFGETCAYVSQDIQRAEVLAVEGVRGHDWRLMGQDFELQHQFTPEKEKPVFHGVLSFPHGEDVGDEKMVEIARRYLSEIEMTNTQYAIVKHSDKAHLHLHVLANRVDNDGKIIGQGMIIERGIRVAERLTREYQLRIEQGKNLSATNLNALKEVDAKRYRLYQAIKETMPGCSRLEDLEKRLLERGITTRYKLDAATGQRVGVSFRIGKLAFKGSQVDRGYSLNGLQRVMLIQEQEMEKQRLELEARQKLEQEARLTMEQELREGLEKSSSLTQRAESKQAEESIEEELRHVHVHRHGLSL